MFSINKAVLHTAFKDTIPVLTGYIVLGFGFGVLLTAHHFPAWLTTFMSITMYAGAMQYLAVDLLYNHIDFLSIAIATFLVNARHLFYGISLINQYKDTGWRKLYLIWGLTDETYSLVTANLHPHDKDYYWYVTILDHLYWICGCTLGGIVGSMLPFNTTGIDFALTALFIVISTEQWLNTDKHFSAGLGIFATVICLFLFSAKNFLIPSIIIICIVLCFTRRYERRWK